MTTRRSSTASQRHDLPTRSSQRSTHDRSTNGYAARQRSNQTSDRYTSERHIRALEDRIDELEEELVKANEKLEDSNERNLYLQRQLISVENVLQDAAASNIDMSGLHLNDPVRCKDFSQPDTVGNRIPEKISMTRQSKRQSLPLTQPFTDGCLG